MVEGQTNAQSIKEEGGLEDLGKDWGIILKWILQK
jgi:hypothetical protein